MSTSSQCKSLMDLCCACFQPVGFLTLQVWQNSTGPADSALPMLSDNLAEFTAFDLLYAIGLPVGQHLRAPLGIALLGVCGKEF